MNRHHRVALLVAAGVAGYCTSYAWADPLARVTIDLQIPQDCPLRAAFFAELRRDLAGSQAPSMPLDVAVDVERIRTNHWRAKVLARGAAGRSERQLSAHNCSALLDAASLIIAMVIDPETASSHARERAAETEGPAAATPTDTPSSTAASLVGDATPTSQAPPAGDSTLPSKAPPSIDPMASNTPPPTKRQPSQLIGPSGGMTTRTGAAPRPRSRVLVSAWSALDLGSLPGLTSAFGGSLGLKVGAWQGEAALGWWWPQDELSHSPLNSKAGGRFGMIAGLGRTCLRLRQEGKFELGPCMFVEAAQRSGTANHQLTNPNPQATHLWDAAVGGGPYASLEISDLLFFRLNLEVLFPLWHQQFGFEKDGQRIEVYRVAAVAGRASFGVELRFR